MSLSNIFANILPLPSSPTQETWVRSKCKAFCQNLGAPSFEDSFGNLWLNAESIGALNSKKIIFVAHMDHPGIVIEKLIDGQALGSWKGGSPTTVKGLPVTVFSDASQRISFQGQIVAEKGDNNIEKVLIKIPSGVPNMPYGACISTVPNGFEFKQPFLVGDRLDDLLSVCVLLSILEETQDPSFAIMLTREEEMGLVGATAFASHNKLPQSVLIMSVDVTEPIRSEVPLGKGMVIRYGDSETALSYPIVHNLEEIARSIPNLQYQILGTSSGDSELTAFFKYGYRVGSVGVPVLNMHNKTVGGEYAHEVAYIPDILDMKKFLSYLLQQK